MQLLIDEFNALPDAPNSSNGVFPLIVAASKGHIGVVQLLLSKYQVNKFRADSSGNGVTHIALLNNDMEMLKMLFCEPSISLLTTNQKDQDILYIACKNGNMDQIKLLVTDFKMDINEQDTAGISPFFGICCKIRFICTISSE